MVAEERPFPCAAVDEVAELGGKGLVGGRGCVVAVGPEVVQDHGQEGDEEEGGIDVGYEVGLVVGGVCEDGLSGLVCLRL